MAHGHVLQEQACHSRKFVVIQGGHRMMAMSNLMRHKRSSGPEYHA